MSSTLKTWFLSAALALSAPGCIIVEDGDDDIGTLTVRWSIIDDVDPRDCLATGSDRLELAVFDLFDDHVTTLYPDCDAFEVTLALEEGFYTAEATLVDRFNASVTTTQIIDDIDVVEDTDLEIFIDFPARSFL